MGTKSQPIVKSSDGNTRFSQNVSKAFEVWDDSTPQNLAIRIGKRPDGSYGGDFAKAGKSVLSGSAADLAFSTAFDSFKVVQKGTLVTSNYSITGTTGEWARSGNEFVDGVAHGLDFTPAFIAYVQFVGDSTEYQGLPQAITEIPSSSSYISEEIAPGTDDTYFFVKDQAYSFGSVSATGGGYQITYYLLQETADGT